MVGSPPPGSSACPRCRSFVLTGLTESQRRQLMLADNRIALNAGWDLEMLQLELKDLTDLGADLSALGFATSMNWLLRSPEGQRGLTDENEAPELPKPR